MKYLCEENFEDLLKKAGFKFRSNVDYHLDYDEPAQLGLYPNANICGSASKHGWAEMIYNLETDEPYEISISSDTDLSYVWVHPHYRDARHEQATDNVLHSRRTNQYKWAETETLGDISDKTRAIFMGETFDPKVEIVMDLPEETIGHIHQLMEINSCTFDEAIELVIIRALEDIKKDEDTESE